MINEFYYSLDWVNTSYIKGKVDGIIFFLNANIIEDYLGTLKEGIQYILTMCLLHHFLNYLPEKDMVGTVLKIGVKF